MIGKRLSHYTVLEEIGRGELQIVYRARDDKLNREVALKILPPELVSEPAKRQRFVQEARDAAALEHPHVGVIHDIDEDEGVLFIAMELLGGRSLADHMDDGPLPLTRAVDLGIGIASGLTYAHEHGIVHRDLKPANVMLTQDGHPKLIDFGLAKLLHAEQNPFLSEAGQPDSPLRSATGEQVIAGTVSYMSPEQARGGTVDARSDIFSFGVLLYHMVSGTPPFEGISRIDTLHSILRDKTPRLAGVSVEERQILQPVIDRCLDKDPDRRYQETSELVEDLRARRYRLESQKSSPLKSAAALLIAVSVLAAAAAAFVSSRPEPVPEPSATKPSLAVLHFENLTDDPELEWLRTGLTDMLVTDLSQSPALEVLGTERLQHILDEIGGEHRLSRQPAMSELARRASVSTVVRGSFAKAGDSIRISARLEDAATGKVILSEKAEGRGQDSVFRLVDEISEGIKANFSVAPLEDELDRDLREVTTASVEAYRSYAEGIRLHERFREEEAIAHFQRAVELDPGFAMALAKLGVVHANLGRHEDANDYAEAALQHLDRLTERERHYIEGWYFSRQPESLDRAIEAYRKAVELYPDHASARHNLGNLLVGSESYEEAIEQLEELRSRGMPFPATYENLAQAYRATGDLHRARAVLEEFRAKNPDDWTTLVSLAELRLESGDFVAAREELDRAEALGATKLRTAPVQWEADILEENWEQARDTAASLLASDAPVEQFVGGHLQAITSLYRGSYSRVISELDGFAASVDGVKRAQPLLLKSRILLEVGRPDAARDAALAIDDESDPYGGARQALLLASIATARLGDHERARELAAEFRQRSQRTRGPAADRVTQLLQGELARARGDYDEALSSLYEAESMLPPRGAEGVHIVIWYALATAHREAGNTGAAMKWYARIIESTGERMLEPIPYVRSFFYLGRLLEQDGRTEKARENYRRFLDHWEQGEIDREAVRQARSALD